MRTLWMWAMLVPLVACSTLAVLPPRGMEVLRVYDEFQSQPTPAQSRLPTVLDLPTIQGAQSVSFSMYHLFADLKPEDPPQSYRDWWAEIAECAGINRPFGDVRWRSSTAIFSFSPLQKVYGVYYDVSLEIVLLRTLSPQLRKHVVKHEILHHLVGYPDLNHEHEAWGRCFGADNN